MSTQYNDIGFFENKNGNGFNTKASPEAVKRLRQIADLIEENGGGVLTFKEIPTKFQRPKGPTFRLDYWMPDDEGANTKKDSEDSL